MNDLLNNVLCKCGHSLNKHAGQLICIVAFPLVGWCHCEKYDQDNLSFLEWKYEQSTK